jgi:pimeloyl-ACP methyl ester carboxylesterase
MLETAQNLSTQLEYKYVTLPDGDRVRYVESGAPDAMPLVMMHGFLGSLRDWRYNVAPLAELARENGTALRTIAVDWIGFGGSSKPERRYSLSYFADFLRDVLAALNISRCYLFGHSMGGKHNLVFAVKYPQYIEKIGLVATDGFLDDPWWTRQTEKPWFKPLANLSTELLGQKRFLYTFLRNVFFDAQFIPSEAEIEAELVLLRQPEYKAFLRMLNRDYPDLSLRLTGYRDRLPEITVPVQIFWGRQDKILNINQGYRALEEIPGAKMHVFDRCGHMPQVEKAAEFNRLALNFLRQ